MTRRTVGMLVVAAGGFAVTVALWRVDDAAAPFAWLAAFATWIGVPLGCLGLILIHALTGGKWGYAIRPQLTAGVTTFPLLPVFLVPLAVEARQIYPWLRPGAGGLQNAFYLNETGALTRSAFYVLVWFGLAWMIIRRFRTPDVGARIAAIAPAGLILLALTATFMSIDLIMSLDPAFPSSVFGLMRIADMGLLALSISLFARLSQPALACDALRQLSRLLLAIVILWAYLAFVELLIVWQSNLPNEASWYAPRLSGGWGALAASVAIMRFMLPFSFLLSVSVQTSAWTMRVVASVLIIGACAGDLWLVGPQANANSVLLATSFVAALVGMAATTLAITWKGDRG